MLSSVDNLLDTGLGINELGVSEMLSHLNLKPHFFMLSSLPYQRYLLCQAAAMMLAFLA